MTESYWRYPGVQSFADNPVSRKIFFGRQIESERLKDQILANRLVVVYAKSGIGKTSLLQAGTAQLLRDEGYLPLFTRVNNIKQVPLLSVFGCVRESLARWDGEYNHGSELSFWHFFKTVEFWQKDRLLTPVLVLDQFEELFTLHPAHVRTKFLSELGSLVRAVRPNISGEVTSDENLLLTDTPPEVRVVISLREDYLGALEEAADHIPQILDHRYRLLPLTVAAAQTAMEGPASVDDLRLKTKPFAFEPGMVQAILEYLSKRTKGLHVQSGNYVEPFHLQLICQRLETLSRDRQCQMVNTVQISLSDLGGEQGLKAILRDFYRNVVNSITPKSRRRKVRRLCEQYLINPEGRRLSLERSEIRRILKLNSDTLNELIDHRLLRSDQRADSWYYELSHDCLVNPILTTRKPQGMLLGVTGLVGSILSALAGFGAVGAAIGIPITLLREDGLSIETIMGIVFASTFCLTVGILAVWLCIGGARKSVETLNRYTTPPT